MTSIDGLPATAAIKARLSEKSVVIVTRYDHADSCAESLRVATCAYVLKENLWELPAGLPDVLLLRSRSKIRSAVCRYFIRNF